VLDAFLRPEVVTTILTLAATTVLGPVLTRRLARREVAAGIRSSDIDGLGRIIDRAYAEMERLERRAAAAEARADAAEIERDDLRRELTAVRNELSGIRHELDLARVELHRLSQRPDPTSNPTP
jgi:chromosome segregation ATPase